MVKRKQYDYFDVIKKYELHCNQIGVEPNPYIVNVERVEEANIIKLINDDGDLV